MIHRYFQHHRCLSTAIRDINFQRKSILVDGTNMLHHFHNNSCTITSNGKPYGAIIGLMRLIRRMAETYQPNYICLYLDTYRITPRKLLDPKYKSKYAKTPAAILSQIESIENLLNSSYPINLIQVPGIEADDLLASYTQQFVNKENHDVLIISNDNDFLQLLQGDSTQVKQLETDEESENLMTVNNLSNKAVTPTVEMYQPNKCKYVRHKSVTTRFGLKHAYLLPGYQAICGTRNGKYKRNAQINDHDAIKLLHQYDSLPMLLRNLNFINDRLVKRQLQRAIGAIEIAYRMTKLQTNLELPVPIDQLKLLRPEDYSLIDSIEHTI